MNPHSLFPTDDDVGLMTDLYQLTMAAGYFHTGLHERQATFEAFVRTLPPNRSYLISAGLEQALHYLTHLHFTDEQISWLRSQPSFAEISSEFFEYLRHLRFTGDVWAMPEGTVFFPNEPVLRVAGDLIQAQLVETYLLNSLTLQTLVASKAARIVQSAQGRPVADFGARRAHGPMAAMLAARGALIGGCAGTSHVDAARRLGVSSVGTQAHSWIMSFDDEQEAFLRYAELFGPHTVCLIDTYDTVAGAHKALAVGHQLRGVRLDSGDLISLSKQVRRILDEGGLHDTKILASGDLNEFRIAELLAMGAPVDLFGVGTEMVTSVDAPALPLVYKLVESADETGRMVPRAKRSAHKATLAGGKQVYRSHDATGVMAGDLLALHDERLDGVALLGPVMRSGRLVTDPPTVQEIAAFAKEQTAALPEGLRQLGGVAQYGVNVSQRLRDYQPSPG